MSSSVCCFLTCLQVSQEAGQVVGYPHLFQNFPPFIVIHTVKGFGIVHKVEIDVFFLEFSCLFNDPADVGNLVSGSSAFSKTSLNIWSPYTQYIISFLIYSIQISIFKHLFCKVEHSYLFIFLLHQSYDLLSIFSTCAWGWGFLNQVNLLLPCCSSLLEVENSSGLSLILLYICLSNNHYQSLASWSFFFFF